MLTRLEMKLSIPEGIEMNINKSSLFHGALMEIVDSEYATVLHEAKLRPYSQNILKTKDNELIWSVCALNEEAYNKIIVPLMKIDEIYIKHNNVIVKIISRELHQTSFDSIFLKNYYGEPNSRYVTLRIETPASLKSNGVYLNYPDIASIIIGLIKRYDAVSSTSEVMDDNLVQSIKDNVSISSYNLRSTVFCLENVKIPSFIGNITLKVCGGELLVNMINMLAEFAEYSGIGIKTAIGMGKVKVIKNRKE